MQFVGIAGLGPQLFHRAPDCIRVQLAQIGRGFRIKPAPRHDGLRATLLERNIVQIGVRPRAEDLQGERRRFGQIAGYDLDLSTLDPP